MWLKYADAPIANEGLIDCEQSSGRPSSYKKPSGFWITDDSENCWRSWCMSERFSLESLTHKHEIVLDESNILILRCPYDLDDFSRDFGTSHWCIDWPKVAARYDGLIITPYQWERRMDHDWYYGWDCASGCIWKANAIKDIRLVAVDYEVAKPKESEAT